MNFGGVWNLLGMGRGISVVNPILASSPSQYQPLIIKTMKMEMAVALASVASASAFVAPSGFGGASVTQRAPTSTSTLSMAAKKGPVPKESSFESEIGVQAPLGFYDPAGLLKNADQERFERLRYVEIKHGRISMLAVAGHLVAQNYRLPGLLSSSANLSFADMPNGVAALSKIPTLGLFQIIAFVGFLELGVMKQKEGSFPGDMTLAGAPQQWLNWSEDIRTTKRVSSPTLSVFTHYNEKFDSLQNA
ncbi:unnamed protein product [Discosporangium mesarthrocarpum]